MGSISTTATILLEILSKTVESLGKPKNEKEKNEHILEYTEDQTHSTKEKIGFYSH